MANSKESKFQPGSSICAYLRDSGASGQEESTSQQESVIREWALSEGLILTRVFKDEARPGSSTTGREGFQDMMHYFRNGASEAGIVIWNFNRFSRDIDDSQYFRADLRRRGFVIHSLNDSIPDTPMGRVFESLIDWKNEQFLQDLSRDIRRGQKHLIIEYHAMPGKPPVGFMREPINIGTRRDGTNHVVHKWVPDPDVISLVTKAFEMRAAGKTYKQIHDATSLYDNKSGYKRMFRNQLFRGVLIHGETVIPDYCEPVINQKTWEAVQAVHKTRSVYSETNHPRRINSNFILSGIIFCGECGGIMNGNVITSKPNRRYTYYRCKNREQRWECGARNIPQVTLETAVLEEMKSYILTPENLAAVQEEAQQLWQENQGNREHERSRIQRQIATLSRKMTNLTDAIADSGGSRTLLEKLQELERREMELLSQLANLDEQPDPVMELDNKKLSTFIQALEIGNDGINELLRNLIHRIEVRREENYIRGTIYYYSPSIADGSAHRWRRHPAIWSGEAAKLYDSIGML